MQLEIGIALLIVIIIHRSMLVLLSSCFSVVWEILFLIKLKAGGYGLIRVVQFEIYFGLFARNIREKSHSAVHMFVRFCLVVQIMIMIMITMVSIGLIVHLHLLMLFLVQCVGGIWVDDISQVLIECHC